LFFIITTPPREIAMFRHAFIPCGILLLACMAIITAAEPVSPKLQAAFARARTERVAVVGMGDSNQRFGGHGWSQHMAQALMARFGAFGTGLSPMYPTRRDDAPADPPAPAAFADLALSGWYVPAGKTQPWHWSNAAQLYLTTDHPLGIAGPLRFHLIHGTFPENKGACQPMVRRNVAPYDILKSVEFNPATGAYGFTDQTLDLPADPARNFDLMFGVVPWTGQVTGPFFGEMLWCENTAKTAGLCYQTLYSRGGQSLFDMLTTCRQEFGPARLTDYFTQLRRQLNGAQTCVVVINSGLNDRNEKEPSIGPKGGFPGDSKDAFGDNLAGIVQALQDAWGRAGGTPETIHFLFMPSHHLSDPDDAKLVAYRQAAAELAASLPNASFIDISKLVSYRDMVEKKYYALGVASDPHLSAEGFAAISQAVADAIASQP